MFITINIMRYLWFDNTISNDNIFSYRELPLSFVVDTPPWSDYVLWTFDMYKYIFKVC